MKPTGVFEGYLIKNYAVACKLQRDIVEDNEMKVMLASGRKDVALIKRWMRNYGLFQGIPDEGREKIVHAFISFALLPSRPASVADPGVLRRIYAALFETLFGEIHRSWMSATSKLLWCMYPDEVAIYDSFVERALVVLQCLESDLAGYPRIGVAPRVEKSSEVAAAVSYYMGYQAIVKRVLMSNTKLLGKLRRKHHEKYPHDIRIIDKLLWMMGNPKHEFPAPTGGGLPRAGEVGGANLVAKR